MHIHACKKLDANTHRLRENYAAARNFDLSPKLSRPGGLEIFVFKVCAPAKFCNLQPFAYNYCISNQYVCEDYERKAQHSTCGNILLYCCLHLV